MSEWPKRCANALCNIPLFDYHQNCPKCGATATWKEKSMAKESKLTLRQRINAGISEPIHHKPTLPKPGPNPAILIKVHQDCVIYDMAGDRVLLPVGEYELKRGGHPKSTVQHGFWYYIAGTNYGASVAWWREWDKDVLEVQRGVL